MKHVTIAVKTILCAAAFLLAMPQAYGAVLIATPDHVEIGTIDEGINAVVKAVIENTGKTQVEIINVQTS